MKSHRSGLLGLALGIVVLGSAACDDQTEVVIPPPQAPPVTIAVSPSGPLDLIVGQTLQFVATVTGGAEGTVRTATWRSSNTAAATVNPTTGLVTGVAPGTTTITAIATADTLAKAAVAVNVIIDPANAPVQIALTKLTIGNTNTPVNVSSVFGQVDATITLDIPQGARVSRVELQVDNQPVASQSFTGTSLMVDAEELQSAVEIVLSWNSAAFAEATGVPGWRNGPHNVRAVVIRPNGTVTATQLTPIQLNNVSFLRIQMKGSGNAQTSVASPRSVAAPGSLWLTGDITNTILNVNYGPDSARVATVSLAFTSSGNGVTGVSGCVVDDDLADNATIAGVDGGDGPGGGSLGTATPGCAPATAARTGTAATNPFDIVFPRGATSNTLTGSSPGFRNVEDVFSVVVGSVTVGGQTGPACVNPDPVFNPQIPGFNPLTSQPFCVTFFANPPRIDNLAPRIARFDMLRPRQYYGPNSFAISHVANPASSCPSGNVDPCLRSADYGVGGQTETGNAAFEAMNFDDTLFAVTGAASLAGKETPSSDCTVPPIPVVCNDYRIRVALKDKSGNSRTLFATPVATTVSDDEDDGVRWGWDETVPTIVQTGGHANNSTNTTPAPAAGWTFNAVDSGIGPSGFDPPGMAVHTKLERFRGIGTSPVCLNPNTGAIISCSSSNNNGIVPDDGVINLPVLASPNGYYQATVFARDAAANQSVTLVLLTLHDRSAGSAPVVGGIGIPATITGGASAAFSSALSDTVELGSLLPYVGFVGGANFVAFARTPIGTYGVSPIVGTNAGAVTIARFPRSLETNGGAGFPSGVVTAAANINYAVNDVAADQLLFVDTPWVAGVNDGQCPLASAPNTGTQNCFVRQVDISASVGGPFASAYTALAAIPFAMQAPSVAAVCNNAGRVSCTAATTPLSTVLTATLVGPVSTFISPFAEVNFYYLDSLGRWSLIGPSAAAIISDNLTTALRTVTYSRAWDVSNPRVRPAGVPPGTAYTVVAIGINATGDLLLSTTQVVNVEGN